jgi:hypothetical protein
MTMRRLRLYILTVMTLIAAGATAQQEVRDSIAVNGNDTVNYRIVYVHDTVYAEKPKAESADLMRIKGIGRFDRGIENFRFIPKKSWIGGITASYVNLDIDDNQLLYSLLKDVDLSGRLVTVNPFIGYAIRDNIVMGVKFGYTHGRGEIGNLAVNYDDLDISIKDMLYLYDSYSVALFHRSYVGIDRGKRFGVFSETTLSYSTGTSSFQREEESGVKRTDTNMNQVRLGLNPGLTVFIMENVSAEVSFGIVGFKYGWESQRNNEGETGKRHTSSADFKINLLNINIGITICI